MFRKVLKDAVEMTRACSLPVDARSLARTVLHTDSFPVMLIQRAREAAKRWRIPLVNRAFRYVQTGFFGIELGKDVVLGEGVYFVHTVGTVIGGDACVGARVRFMGNNTVGTAKDNGYPTLEEDVEVGVGARILGPVRIGAGAKIGANAVVVTDVPPGAVAVGIPAVVRFPRHAQN
jgi:serine O-acetyltransferase